MNPKFRLRQLLQQKDQQQELHRLDQLVQEKGEQNQQLRRFHQLQLQEDQEWGKWASAAATHRRQKLLWRHRATDVKKVVLLQAQQQVVEVLLLWLWLRPQQQAQLVVNVEMLLLIPWIQHQLDVLQDRGLKF